jgi:hypothetical protein
MSEIGPHTQFSTTPTGAAAISPLRIVEDGDDFLIDDEGDEAAILVVSGDDLEFDTAGDPDAIVVSLGDNIHLVEV